jgi:tetratricopeptide (TPR) repeat protein
MRRSVSAARGSILRNSGMLAHGGSDLERRRLITTPRSRTKRTKFVVNKAIAFFVCLRAFVKSRGRASAAFTLSAACAASAAAQPRVTFTKDIAPIVWSRCAACHRAGEIGPFSLVTYDDVKRHLTQVADATARRIMPPWKPEPESGPFDGDRRLTDAELNAIQTWIKSGAPEGEAADLPPQPKWSSTWALGTPDVIVTMPAPYTVPPDGTDLFRTFVLPIPADEPHYVRAMEFRPGNARVVHHASIGIDRTRSSRVLDQRDPEPGYVGGMVPDARYPEGQLLGWTPGQAPHAVPDGMAWRLERGSDLVVQIHMQPTGKPEPLQVSVGFYFTNQPPTRQPVGLRLGSETIDIAPGVRDYVVHDKYTVPVDVDVIAVQPHAHNLARRMNATATRPDGHVIPLITIADWDFRWQDVYRFVTPVVLPKGTAIAMWYTYDNSSANPRNPRRPPARVVWGQNTSDEMGDLWVQLVPRNREEFAALNADVQRKRAIEDVGAYTKLLAGDPANPLRHDAVASLYFETGQIDKAIEHYSRSLQLNPVSAATHYNIGIAYAARGRRDDAIAQFEEAIRLDPDYAQAHNNAGALLQLQGKVADALAHYRKAVALRPDNVEARSNLGQLLSATGDARAAVDQFRAALALRADDPQALVGLAWIQATATDASLRNAVEAVRHAEAAAAIVGKRNLLVLDALAAAYAAADRFEDATATVQSAVEIAESQKLAEIAARFRERLALYQQKRKQP